MDACTQPGVLQAVAELTSLGMRATRPRVYVVASLAGGSGSGMFLDLAYVVRDILKRMGQNEPEVVGLFILPGVKCRSPQRLPLGNTVAALTELSHFTQEARFSARYFERDAVIQETAPPFQRCMLLSFPDDPKAGESEEILAQAADFLFRDLCTPLGRAGDEVRAEQVQTIKGSDHNPFCQTFGLYKFVFPRRELLQRFARCLCHKLVGRWMSKEDTSVHNTVETVIQEQWSRHEYGPDAFIEQLQAGCAKTLGQEPEVIFAHLTADLANQAPVPPDAVGQVLLQLEKYIGKPGEATATDSPCRLQEVLGEVGDRVVALWSQRLAELVVRLIEMPEVRLGGAEEGIRCLVAMIQQMLEHQEPFLKELGDRAEAAFQRIQQAIVRLSKPGSPRGQAPLTSADVQELLRSYAKWCYQNLILRQVIQGLLSLRGLLSDELREVNACRTRLGELLRIFEDPVSEPGGQVADRFNSLQGEAPGRRLFPHGSATLDEALAGMSRQVTPAQSDGPGQPRPENDPSAVHCPGSRVPDAGQGVGQPGGSHAEGGRGPGPPDGLLGGRRGAVPGTISLGAGGPGRSDNGL